MPVKLTTEQFIQKAVLKYGNKYCYDKVLYKSSKEYIIITCKDHGDFSQIPNSHLSGYGCPKCVKNYKCDTSDFIQKAIKVHNNKYHYNKVLYCTSIQEVIITCKEHGDFEQKPRDHIAGYGCAKCAKNHSYNTEEFIEAANKKHNNLYDYSKTIYTLANDKVIISCYVHGDFEQKAGGHLFGKGCSKCSPNAGSVKLSTIDSYFSTYNVQYEYRYTDCKYKRELPFDRFISDLNLLIEYDGEQHFMPVMHWGAEAAFKLQIKKDQIKNDFCIKNEINLLRISYKDDIVSEIDSYMNDLKKCEVLIKIHGEIKFKKS